MELKVYPLLIPKCKLCITRKKWRWGKEYQYNPRGHLVRRLAGELGMTEDEVKEQIAREREYLLRYPQYY